MQKPFPQIELHCHLDGSLRPETVLSLLDKPVTDENLKWAKSELIAPSTCDSLDTYLKRFMLPIRLMQSYDALKRIAFEVMEDAALENVKYLEIRYAPQLHVEEGLTYQAIIEAVIEGIRLAESKYEIKGNVILSYLRNTSVEGLFELVEAGKSYLNKGVVAVDLCGGERDAFSERFIAPIEHARSLGYRVTIHAGETGIGQNMVDAITLLGAERLGHGVAMASHKEAFDLVQSKGVTIECCPTSNLQTKAVGEYLEHPIQDFLNQGIKVTLNTDNRTVSNTTMTEESQHMVEAFGWSIETFKTIYLIGVEASFADDATKNWLRRFVK